MKGSRGEPRLFFFEISYEISYNIVKTVVNKGIIGVYNRFDPCYPHHLLKPLF